MVLVAAPMARMKEYSFPAWERATRPYRRLLAASDGWSGSVPSVPYEEGIFWFNSAWRALLDNSDEDLIVSLEVDVIPQVPEWCERLTEEYVPGTFVRHQVPWRKKTGRDGYCYEMGCTLADRETFNAALEFGESSQMKLYTVVGNPYFFKYKDVDLFEVKHLDN